MIPIDSGNPRVGVPRNRHDFRQLFLLLWGNLSPNLKDTFPTLGPQRRTFPLGFRWCNYLIEHVIICSLRKIEVSFRPNPAAKRGFLVRASERINPFDRFGRCIPPEYSSRIG